jgi:hypothetical protein
MTRMFRMVSRFSLVAAVLGLSACAGVEGEEPLYVLRDSLGRSVAMAGRSQLGDAAPGTMVRASIGGTEQDLMVGERVGMGPVMQARPAAEQTAMTSTALDAPPPAITAAAAAPVENPPRTARRAGGTTARVTETGVNPSARRRGPPSRAVSRSVM